MQPYFEGQGATIYHGDCLDVLRELPDCSVDSVVTDPPYALGFMGREWDSFGGVKGITDPAIRKAQQEKWGTAFGASARPAKPAEGEMLRFQLWSQEWAAEALRVLKPGGHLLAFGGTHDAVASSTVHDGNGCGSMKIPSGPTLGRNTMPMPA